MSLELKAHGIARVKSEQEGEFFAFEFRIGQEIVERAIGPTDCLAQAMHKVMTVECIKRGKVITADAVPIFPDGGADALPEKTLEELNKEL